MTSSRWVRNPNEFLLKHRSGRIDVADPFRRFISPNRPAIAVGPFVAVVVSGMGESIIMRAFAPPCLPTELT